ncbi:hypothetical protein A7J57_16940 [Agrobacterium tumefaciens]|uniref:Uncharacterized protein n=1 Tax=Agrobacterium tumefaciens TaxID=358 RepID=A0A176WYX0_AGRTU|nr:hypothetical protein A7J57_16940 [Agrobacterium tumefaciens]
MSVQVILHGIRGRFPLSGRHGSLAVRQILFGTTGRRQFQTVEWRPNAGRWRKDIESKGAALNRFSLVSSASFFATTIKNLKKVKRPAGRASLF